MKECGVTDDESGESMRPMEGIVHAQLPFICQFIADKTEGHQTDALRLPLDARSA